MTLRFTQAAHAVTHQVSISSTKSIYDHVATAVTAQGYDPAKIMGFKILGTDQVGNPRGDVRFGSSTNPTLNAGYAAASEVIDEPVSNPRTFYIQDATAATTAVIIVYLATHVR